VQQKNRLHEFNPELLAKYSDKILTYRKNIETFRISVFNYTSLMKAVKLYTLM